MNAPSPQSSPLAGRGGVYLKIESSNVWLGLGCVQEGKEDLGFTFFTQLAQRMIF